MPRKKSQAPAEPKDLTGESKSEVQTERTEVVGPELTPEILERLQKAWDGAATYYHPLFLEIVDTGAPDGEGQHIHEISQILREASDRMLALVGYDREDHRDLGRYGLVYDSRDGLPPEMRVAYDCICKAHGDALTKWQRDAVRWRADQAMRAEARNIRAEWEAAQAPERSAAEASKPKRRPRRRKGQEPASQ